MSDLFAPTDPPSPPATLQAPYLTGLNESQREAVEALDGPLLVLAGAGTGKTRVLTTRLSHLLRTGKTKPWNILAVTFTNKAAREMRDRVTAAVGPVGEQVWLGTFHALCARILRRHAELVGLESNFTILDTDDQLRLLKQILQAEGVDDKRWPARVLMSTIQRWKDRGLDPEKVGTDEAGDLAGGKLQDLYRQYQERLRIQNAVDFGDLLLLCLKLFQEQPEVLAEYHRRFTHILVDEYQDTNVAQYLWLRLLAQARRNICCVGDDDQSIYGWRGAEIGNILRFESDFPGAKVVRLEENYRSTSRILAAASGLIAHNEGRLGKTLWTKGNDGDPVVVRGVWDGEDEARAVAEEVEAHQRRGTPLSELAILVRAGFQTREFEERFLTLGVPYRVVGGARFYERMEIRDAIAYLRVIAQPSDDLAFERIHNTPARGIGKVTMQAVHHLARMDGIPLLEAAARIVETDELKPAAKRKLHALVEDFRRWREAAQAEDHADLCRIVLDESGYTAKLKADKSPEAPGRLENLKELVGAMEEFESLPAFLEHISLVMENTETAGVDQVTLMTLHAAKGLEFDVVFLPGWEDGMFPNQRALDESGAAGLEEERRLAYVGLTRARKHAEISFAANRRIHGMWQSAVPSRFISEIPEAVTEVKSETGLYADPGLTRSRWADDHDDFTTEPIDQPVFDRARGFGGGGWSGAGYGSGSDAKRGPGYGRRGGQSRARPPLIDADGYTVDLSKPPAHGVGDRVFHQKFGMGTVNAVDGDKLEISFDHAGDKKVVATFVSKPS